jgi:flagellar motor switch protein FliG
MQQRAIRQVVRRLAEFGDMMLGDKPDEAYA